jgi:hypothetical protein
MITKEDMQSIDFTIGGMCCFRELNPNCKVVVGNDGLTVFLQLYSGGMYAEALLPHIKTFESLKNLCNALAYD